MTLTAVELWAANDFEPLAGKRIALVTHMAALDWRGKPALEVYLGSPRFELIAILSPLGGFDPAYPEKATPKEFARTGDAKGTVAVTDLAATNGVVPAAVLAACDTVVIDLQDTGLRSSLAITTLGVVMEQCHQARKAVLVVDRPNPLGGLEVAGPIQDPELYGQVASYFPMPLQHGMTLGEIATMANDFFGIAADLTVVPMQGWSRNFTYLGTRRPWAAPAPALRSPQEALLWPGLAIVQPGGLSLGQGTQHEGSAFGAPFLDAPGLVAELQAANWPAGLQAQAVRFTPVAGPHAGRECAGVRLSPVAGQSQHPLDLGMFLLATLERRHATEFDQDACLPVLGRRALVTALNGGIDLAAAKASYTNSIVAFQAERFKVLLYRN